MRLLLITMLLFASGMGKRSGSSIPTRRPAYRCKLSTSLSHAVNSFQLSSVWSTNLRQSLAALAASVGRPRQ
jgi:hypothetical protein